MVLRRDGHWAELQTRKKHFREREDREDWLMLTLLLVGEAEEVKVHLTFSHPPESEVRLTQGVCSFT